MKKRKLLENLVCTRDVCKTYEIFKFLLYQCFLRVSMKLEHTSVARDFAEFANLTVFR